MHLVLAHIVIKIDVFLFKLLREENCDDDGTVGKGSIEKKRFLSGIARIT